MSQFTFSDSSILYEIFHLTSFSLWPHILQGKSPPCFWVAKNLTNFNWWGHTALHIREGKERINHLEGLILGIKMELDAIVERRGALIEEKKKLDKTTSLYHEMMAQL